MEYHDEKIMQEMVNFLFEMEIPSYKEISRFYCRDFNFDQFDWNQDWVDIFLELCEYQQEDPDFILKKFHYMETEDTILNLAAKFDRIDVIQLLDFSLLATLLESQNENLYIDIVTRAYDVSSENFSVRCEAYIMKSVYCIIDKNMQERCADSIYENAYNGDPLLRAIQYLDPGKLYKLIKDDTVFINDRHYLDLDDSIQLQAIRECTCDCCNDVTYDAFTAISYAAMKGKWEHAKVLYRSGADIYKELIPGCTRKIGDYILSKLENSSTPTSIKTFFEIEMNVHWCFSYLEEPMLP